MADNEPHAVVRLLLKRMESHPEEFKRESYEVRWEEYIDAIQDHGNEADNAALNAKLRDIRLAEIHEQVMDELLNGPERRRKHKEDTEYERHLAAAMQHTKQQAMQQIAQQGGMVQGLMNTYGGGGGGSGASLPVSTSPYSSGGGASLPVNTSPYSNTITGLKANSLVIDDQVLDGPMIKKIKRMMTGRSK